MKHSVEEIKAEYRRLDQICCIDSRYIPIKISTKAIRRYGSCSYRTVAGRTYVKYITISDFILECEEQFWDTIRHEYAHMLVTMRDGKCHGHDAVWKAACKEVGCSPNRLATNQEAHEQSAQRRMKRAKYRVSCQECGREWTYVKAGVVVKKLQQGKGKTLTCPCGSHALKLKVL